jgi:L-ascorbate metabolism protein UlaG (beta-lactamase superfamily)
MYLAVWRLYWARKEMVPFVASSYLPVVEPAVRWLGHATMVCEIAGMRVIIDPIFGNISPFFRRIISIEHLVRELPPIDLVLITHNHWDHADHRSLRMIARQNPRAQLAVPLGDRWWAERLGFADVSEYQWGDSREYGQVRATFLPARHWSQCTPFNRNQALWGSWMVEGGGYTVYHAGDTAPWDHFAEIAQAFPRIDCAALPIGPCAPRSWLAQSHIGPADALWAAQQLNARMLLPIHWGTYWFGIDRPLAPYEMLYALAAEQSLERIIHAPRMGEPLSLSKHVF